MTKPQESFDKLHAAWEAAKKPMEEFTETELSDLDDKIKTALIQMLMRNEFFGIVALKLRKDITTKVKSAATDGRVIYFNPGFVQALTLDETTFLIAHEVYHCVFEHFLRRDKRNPMLWNIAGDYVINGICQRDNLGKIIEGALVDRKYDGKTTEEIYEDLQQQMEENLKNLETLDDHFDVSDMDDEDGDGDGKPGEGGKGFGKISEEEAKAIQDEIRSSVIQAAKAAGDVPGEIKRIVDGFLKPKIDWRDLLAVTVASKVPYDTSFSNPHRRSWSNSFGAMFPGDVPDQEINIAIGLDVSGSFTDEMIKESLSEVRGIMQTYSSFKIQVWTFDTKVQGYAEFTQDNIDEISNYEIVGGGGTAIASNWKYMEDNEIEADMFVCFTDLYSNDLDTINPDFIDTVWVILDSKDAPPFGAYAYYADMKNK